MRDRLGSGDTVATAASARTPDSKGASPEAVQRWAVCCPLRDRVALCACVLCVSMHAVGHAHPAQYLCVRERACV